MPSVPTWLAAAAALLALASPAAAAPAPLEPTPVADRTYTEGFHWIGDLDDGTYLQAQVAITNVGLGGGRVACRLLVVEPGHDPWTATGVAAREAWSFTSDPAPRLTVGPCTATATADAVTLAAPLPEGTLSLTLASPARPVSPPDHTLKAGSSFYETELLVPWAELVGELELRGRPPRPIHGRGYADHSRSTVLPSDLARGWLRFRALAPKCATLLLLRAPPHTHGLQGWLWTGAADAPRAEAGTAHLPPDAPGLPEPFDVTLGALVLHVTPTERVYRYAPHEQYGLLGRAIAALVGRDITTTFRAKLDGLPGCPATPGILEVSVID